MPELVRCWSRVSSCCSCYREWLIMLRVTFYGMEKYEMHIVKT
jgi:hypothetical protein